MTTTIESTTRRELLTPSKALLIGLLILGAFQESLCRSDMEKLKRTIPTKLEHEESGTDHYKLATLKMNGVQHRPNSDENVFPPHGYPIGNNYPPRPGRRSLISSNSQWFEPGGGRPGRRSLVDQVRFRPRPGRDFVPQNSKNPFDSVLRPGRNSEEDMPWVYSGSSLRRGENKESHTFEQVAPKRKLEFLSKQVEI